MFVARLFDREISISDKSDKKERERERESVCVCVFVWRVTETKEEILASILRVAHKTFNHLSQRTHADKVDQSRFVESNRP